MHIISLVTCDPDDAYETLEQQLIVAKTVGELCTRFFDAVYANAKYLKEALTRKEKENLRKKFLSNPNDAIVELCKIEDDESGAFPSFFVEYEEVDVE